MQFSVHLGFWSTSLYCFVQLFCLLALTQKNYDNLEQELRRHQELDTQHEEERAQLRQSKQESDNDIAVLRGSYCRLIAIVFAYVDLVYWLLG